MKRSNKWMSVIFAVMMITVLALSGCSGAATEENANENEQEAEKNEQKDTEETTLRVAFGLSESEWELMRQEVLPAFQQKTGIKVKAIELKQENLINKLTAEVESGNQTIDMFSQDVNNLASLVTRGLVEDLSKYKNELPDQVISGMVEASTFDEKLLFLPFRPNVEIAFYNQKKFDKYGLEVPETWDELLKVAKTLKEKTGQGRVAIKANLQGDNILHMFDYIRAAGGDPYVLNDEGSIKAFKFMQKLYPYLSEQSSTANWDTMNKYLAKDSVYLGQNWPFYIPEFHKQGKDEIKAYSGWSGPVKESHVLGGSVIGIPKGSEKVEEAVEFAKFLMSKPVQELLVSELAWPAVRSDAYGLVEGYQEPYFKAIKKALKKAEPRGNKPYWGEAQDIYITAFQKAVVNGEDVEKTLNNAANKLQKLKESDSK
jgi:trehalose transport system substrate-binding protein